MEEKNKIEAKKIIEDLLKNLFSLLELPVEFKVIEEKDFYLVDLNTKEQIGLLIGRQGENLNALRTFLQLALKQKTGQWYSVKVNVGDWLERQEEYLRNLAEKTVKKVKETGAPQNLYNLTAQQRKIIHLVVGDIEGVKSESVGEGKNRFLVISPDVSKKGETSKEQK